MEEVTDALDSAPPHESDARHRRWRRALVVAIPAGVLAAALSVVSGTWALNHFGPQPTDGNFVLDQPGVYSEPTGTGSAASSASTNPAVAGRRLPAVDLVDATGATTRLTITRPTIINLWFSTCPPCERELPDFVAIDAEFGDRIDIVGVDPFDTVDTMLRFADERGVQYPLLRDPTREFTNALGVVAFPITLFVDADGVIVRQLGVVDAATLRSNIAELFPASDTTGTVESDHDDNDHDDNDRDDNDRDDNDDHDGDREDDD